MKYTRKIIIGIKDYRLNMPGFAKYGLKELLGGVFFFAALAVLAGFFCPWLMPLPLTGCIFTAYFFRDPARRIPQESNLVLSPADGTVADISEIDETEFMNCRTLKIGIFMSIFSVHINRMPVSGKIEFTRHNPGEFLNALRSDSALRNENNLTGAYNEERQFRFMVKQIAGIIARRIVCACKPGDSLQKGEQFGMIKFGSRTEVYIPKDKIEAVMVKTGDKVNAGITILGTLK